MKKDIRTQGSGNAGATNIRRVMGNKFALIVFLVDALKGIIPTYLGLLYGGLEVAYLCGILVVLGHVFPVFLQFKGGKGVATSFGAGLVLNPLIALLSIIAFVIVVWKSRYVSLGSIIGTCMFPLLIIISDNNYKIKILSVLFALIVVFSHRSNIRKLIAGEENKLS